MPNRDEIVESFREGVRRFQAAMRGEYRMAMAYRSLFIANGELTPDGEQVLYDLMRFARETDHAELLSRTATGATDPYMAGVIEGRRQVVSRIGRALWMPADEFERMKHGAYDERNSLYTD